MFPHRLEQLRQQRDSQQAYAAAVKDYTDRGYRVIEDTPVWGDTCCVALHHLRTADGKAATEAAITDPAHWAVALYEEDGYADAETGDIVAEDTIDWSTQDDDEAQPGEGLRHANSVVDKTIYLPDWYCVDYQARACSSATRYWPPVPTRPAGPGTPTRPTTATRNSAPRPAPTPKPNEPKPCAANAAKPSRSTGSEKRQATCAASSSPSC
jgi:hypothetical protein